MEAISSQQTAQWSHEQICREFPDSENLTDLIQAVEARFRPRGQVICSIRVNGMRIDENDEDRFQSCKVEEVQNLEVGLREVDILISESLESTGAYLKKLEVAVLKTSDLMRLDELKEATRWFDSVLTGFTNAVSLISGIRSAALGAGLFADDPQFGTKWADCQKDFFDKIEALMGAFEKRDFILVADILEYDLTKVLENWNQHLEAINESNDRNRQGLSSA